MTTAPSLLDAQALATELRNEIRGEVRFDNGSRALYATDGSNYRQVPIGVVIPKSIDDVVAAVAACSRHGAPVLSRGGGTSLAGQCCNVAVIMDMSKYLDRILDLDPEKKTARVEPGCVLDNLRDAAEKFHLTFAPDPSTHTHNTLGGMIGNNSCGVHSVMGGKTVDNVISLDVLLYDGTRMKVGKTSPEELEQVIAEGGRRGEIYSRLKALRDKEADRIRARYPKIPRRVSGYNLDELLPENHFDVARALVGTESTCVVILEATLRLVDSPPGRSLLVLGYPDVYSAGDHIPDILGFNPIGLEGIDDRLISDMKAIGLHPEDVQLLPEGGGWLLAEFGGKDKAESDAHAHACMDKLKQRHGAPSMKLFDDPLEEQMIWKVRESGLGATAHVPNKKITWEGWEDAAVPPEKVGPYLRDFRKLLDKFGYGCDLYGHFGQGCIHTRIDFDLETHDGIEIFHSFLDEAADLVVSYGGSLSGEHGDGQSKAEFLPKMFGEELVRAFREFKSIWDPDGKMNPGKIVDAYLPTQNLRLGTDYNPPQPETHFRFPKDKGNFGRVTLRCVGIGNCRQQHSQTMCPSYKATREEKHSTRGRARLLFETMRGEVIRDSWQSEEMKDSLDLCLACKGCLGDCPVNVDMATYKAEFLSHYYEHKARPRQAYAFGLIDRWARLAAYMPGAVNWIMQAPGLSRLAKNIAGMSHHRRIPSFASQTFLQWFEKRHRAVADKGRTVILWPDTFNNHFYPETAKAAVAVLEAAGFHVRVPAKHICCGRPLYDFGMLDQAKSQLRQILAMMQDDINNGVPVVGLEPACVAVFRDELMNLLPGDEVAKRLSRQTYFFTEFLMKKAPGFRYPKLARKAILHGHCHQKALIRMDDEKAVLGKMNMNVENLDSGCCGMAGSFGFDKDKYEISIQIGESVLLPAIRSAEPETLIIADGYSCREQISQTTNRRSLHAAEVIHMALNGPAATSSEEP